MLSGIFNQETMSIVAWLNLMIVLYVFFSLYYQWKIAKQWCPMCLVIQLVLVLQFVIAFSGDFYQSPTLLEFPILLTFTLSFIIVFITVQMLIPALKEAKESKAVNHELLRLKHNPLIFDALLAKQKKIETSTEGLGITLGNPDAKYKLIKVCNPYCGPCASAHVVIDELLENNSDIQLQIIFTGNGEDSDFRTAPIRHLLAITEQGDSHLNKQALNDWYLAEKKDYEVFAAIYPINGDLKLQTPKVKLMYEWCEKEKIQFTPTLFVNGYQLPEQYSIANLRYFLSV
jgi:thiol-disulfide isomerase/thioredoxin